MTAECTPNFSIVSDLKTPSQKSHLLLQKCANPQHSRISKFLREYPRPPTKRGREGSRMKDEGKEGRKWEVR
jgi:hypothetical protein